ncbi:hypothetical protein BC835DRAFT_1391116 [Cytidiella melzeri]|nr:hypothetical protein BC835DRAFT_1391116 [Cytidiella melzeri]
MHYSITVILALLAATSLAMPVLHPSNSDNVTDNSSTTALDVSVSPNDIHTTRRGEPAEFAQLTRRGAVPTSQLIQGVLGIAFMGPALFENIASTVKIAQGQGQAVALGE